jgi:hypothetical protein
MKGLSRFLTGVALGAGALVFTAANASADIVCSGRVCWHAHEHHDYPRDARVVVHPDDWHWGRREHFEFREHEGRGYWRGGRWIEIER